MTSGKFIVVEGIDGSGKTTQTKLLEERLGEMGIQTILTREPGGTELGERLRTFAFANKFPSDLDSCLMYSARLLNLEQTIRPALECGIWVICDRFTSSTWAYQSGASIDVLVALDKALVNSGLPMPDLEFFLTLDHATSAARRRNRAGDAVRFEEQLEVTERAYASRYREHPPAWPVKEIYAGQGLAKVTDAIMTNIIELVSLPRS